MSCKSLLYGANTSLQNVSDGGNINFGSVVRKFGNNVNMSGGNAVVIGQGYYTVKVDVTLSTSAAEPVTVSIYKDGSLIPGASQTITTGAATSIGFNVDAVIRQICCCESVITVSVTGSESAVSNATIIVEKE